MKELYKLKELEKVIACGIITVIFPQHGNKPLRSRNQLVRLSGMFPLEQFFLYSIPQHAIMITMFSRMS